MKAALRILDKLIVGSVSISHCEQAKTFNILCSYISISCGFEDRPEERFRGVGLGLGSCPTTVAEFWQQVSFLTSKSVNGHELTGILYEIQSKKFRLFIFAGLVVFWRPIHAAAKRPCLT